MARSAPDPEAPVSLAQNSFAAGEVAPGLYGRQDLQKYGTGCAVMRNFFVDPRGGATIRPGTQFIGYPATPGWDPVTGLGTPNAANLVPALAAG